MLCRLLAALGAAALLLVLADPASAQVSVTASYGAASRVGAGPASITFTIVNNGPALANPQFLYTVTGPTSFGGANFLANCGLGSTLTATQLGIGVAPAQPIATMPANLNCSLTMEFNAAVGTHTLSSATLSYGGGSVNLTPGANPTLVVSPIVPVPTLSEWAMILFGVILAGGAALILRRRMART